MKHLPARALAGLLAVTLLNGCFGCRFEGSLTIDLIAPPAASAALAVLKKGDLAEARRILEPKLAAKPGDAGLSYTLGCVDLLQSDQTADRSSKREMQTRGWQRVEAAAGRYYPADFLLSHAYRVGRWGKKRSHTLYLKHLRTTCRRYDFPHSEQDWDEIHRRTWAKLAPGEQTLFNEGGTIVPASAEVPVPVTRQAIPGRHMSELTCVGFGVGCGAVRAAKKHAKHEWHLILERDSVLECVRPILRAARYEGQASLARRRFRRPDGRLRPKNVLHLAKAVSSVQACAVHLCHRSPRRCRVFLALPTFHDSMRQMQLNTFILFST